MNDTPKAYSAWVISMPSNGFYWDGKAWIYEAYNAVKFLFEDDARRSLLGIALMDGIDHNELRAEHHSWGHMDEVVTVNLSDDERKFLSERAAKHDMSREGVMRRGLRVLSAFDWWHDSGCIVEVRTKDGELVHPFSSPGCGVIE